MSKTVFAPYGTVVTSKFCQAIYGGSNDAALASDDPLRIGHIHDGADEDGHAAKIELEHIAGSLEKWIISLVSDRFIGDIRAYAGNIASIPEGYRPCDGSSAAGSELQPYRDWVDKSGRGDLKDENNVYYFPDYRGQVLVGAGTHKDVNNDERNFSIKDKIGGEYAHKLTVNEMPSHKHDLPNKDGSELDWGIGDWDKEGGWWNNTSLRGGDEPHNNIQPYSVVNYIIRVV